MILKERMTNETRIALQLELDGTQQIQIHTGLGMFDHLLRQLAFHAGWDLELQAKGDLEIDDHHLIEDVALTLGAALQEGWRARVPLARYGQRLLPMDETLIMCAIDLSGRPFCQTKLRLNREKVGDMACEMVPHFFHSLAMAGQFTLHLRQVTGRNHHHIVEASFKALAYAFKEALRREVREVSTKGAL